MELFCSCASLGHFSGDIETGKTQVVFVGHHKGVPGGVAGHTGQVLAVAVSSDGKYVVSVRCV